MRSNSGENITMKKAGLSQVLILQKSTSLQAEEWTKRQATSKPFATQRANQIIHSLSEVCHWLAPINWFVTKVHVE